MRRHSIEKKSLKLSNKPPCACAGPRRERAGHGGDHVQVRIDPREDRSWLQAEPRRAHRQRARARRGRPAARHARELVRSRQAAQAARAAAAAQHAQVRAFCISSDRPTVLLLCSVTIRVQRELRQAGLSSPQLHARRSSLTLSALRRAPCKHGAACMAYIGTGKYNCVCSSPTPCPTHDQVLATTAVQAGAGADLLPHQL